MFGILVPWYAAILHDFSRRHNRFELLIPILFFPLWLPYAWVVRGLRSSASGRTVKRALAVAVGCGSLIIILCIILFVLASFDADRAVMIAYSLVGLLQILFVAGATTTYYSMRREPGDLQILLTRLWVPIVGIACAAIVLPNVILYGERAPNEASGVGSLRTINTAQVSYAQSHPDKGFATSLAELGPDSADLIDSVLASGRKSSYVFAIIASPPDSDGRITHYTLIARPQKYGKDGRYSFLTDESGVQHFTTDDRSPTAQDPVLE